MATRTFSVDTKLFRELGELLVGRDSTALVELIKNAYDADATLVRVHAEGLRQKIGGKIVVTDNGSGMDDQAFSKGFLRIASRSKVEGVVRSPYFKRRFTGEKGVGRLAAHKLARMLTVVSRVWDGGQRDALDGFPCRKGLTASIDWDAIEAAETFDQIESKGAISVEPLKDIGRNNRAGTVLTLTNLRRVWTDRDLTSFFEEVATLVPPLDLSEPIPNNFVAAPHLFETPLVRDQRQPGSFELHFSGDLKLQEADNLALRNTAHWLIEVVGSKRDRTVQVSVAPTNLFRKRFPRAEGFFLTKVADKDLAIDFQARIFQRGGRSWPVASRGVRVYYEGFRVLPYGDTSNDWLGLDRDYRSRSASELGRLQDYAKLNSGLPKGDDGEGMVLQGTNAFFGAVFLTREGASDLQMLVNREGFLPSQKLDFIADMVRLGTDLHVRLQRAATTVPPITSPKDPQKQAEALEGDPNKAPTAIVAREAGRLAASALEQARVMLSAGDVTAATASLDLVERQMATTADLVDGIASEATIFRVMASLGLEQAAFVHEVNSLALVAETIAKSLDELSESLPVRQGRLLKRITRDVCELKERLRRNIIFLTDVVGIEGRRRRSRSSIRSSAERVLGFLRSTADDRQLSIENRIGEKVMSPPVFPAELTAIFSNLLSNAVKFSNRNGRIRLEGDALDGGGAWFSVQNSGTAVDLRTAERWFQAFQSTTGEVDARLGHGMGLGLTITRSLVSEYGGTIRFISPSAGFATAIRVELPGR